VGRWCGACLLRRRSFGCPIRLAGRPRPPSLKEISTCQERVQIRCAIPYAATVSTRRTSYGQRGAPWNCPTFQNRRAGNLLVHQCGAAAAHTSNITAAFDATFRRPRRDDLAPARWRGLPEFARTCRNSRRAAQLTGGNVELPPITTTIGKEFLDHFGFFVSRLINDDVGTLDCCAAGGGPPTSSLKRKASFAKLSGAAHDAVAALVRSPISTKRYCLLPGPVFRAASA